MKCRFSKSWNSLKSKECLNMKYIIWRYTEKKGSHYLTIYLPLYCWQSFLRNFANKVQLVPAYIVSILFGGIDKLFPDLAIFKSKAIRFYHKSTRVCPGIEGNEPKMLLCLKLSRKFGVFIGDMCWGFTRLYFKI